jgi:hypothetical protein
MYQQRIEEKHRELEDAHVMLRAARNAALNAEGRDHIPGSELVRLRTELTHAEENAFWLTAELDALNELQAEHLEATRMTRMS